MNQDPKRSAITQTMRHIARVQQLMNHFAERLVELGRQHDKSKYSPEELGPLTEMQTIIDREGQAPYGSEEYKRRTAILGPMLEHHYANNPHHPEHHKNGINDMDLFNVVEMFLDWKAASERGEEPAMNLTTACERFQVSPQLQSIFQNTADRLGFKWV